MIKLRRGPTASRNDTPVGHDTDNGFRVALAIWPILTPSRNESILPSHWRLSSTYFTSKDYPTI